MKRRGTPLNHPLDTLRNFFFSVMSDWIAEKKNPVGFIDKMNLP
jgi:hypothetical protein